MTYAKYTCKLGKNQKERSERKIMTFFKNILTFVRKNVSLGSAVVIPAIIILAFPKLKKKWKKEKEESRKKAEAKERERLK